jgi:hypothetical protein
MFTRAHNLRQTEASSSIVTWHIQAVSPTLQSVDHVEDGSVDLSHI